MPELMTTAKANKYRKNYCDVYEDDGMVGIHNLDSVRLNFHDPHCKGYVAVRYDKIDELIKYIKFRREKIVSIDLKEMHMRANLLMVQTKKKWVISQLEDAKELFR